MACNLGASFSFGPYTATYDLDDANPKADLGLVEQAWFMESQAEARDIRASRYGESIIDGIYVGQNVFMIVRLKEWTQTVRRAIHPWADDGAALDKDKEAVLGRTGAHGRCMADMARELELTAIPGSPAATLGPITITAPLAIYAPRHNLQIPFGNLERDIHIVFQLYPVLVNAIPQTPIDSLLKHFVVV